MANLGSRCDLIVVVGGRRQHARVARDLADTPALVVGVNRGGLGFLADVSPDQIEQKIGAVLAGEYTVDERALLEARIVRGGESAESCVALNDVVVNAGAASRMMDFKPVRGRRLRLRPALGRIDRVHADRVHGLRPVRGRADHAPEPGRHRRGADVSAYADIASARGARPTPRSG